jgi:hypothetical protein
MDQSLFTSVHISSKIRLLYGMRNFIMVFLTHLNPLQTYYIAPLFCSCCSQFELTTTVKRFFSLQILNPKTVSRTPWTGDQPVARELPTHKHRLNTDIHVLSVIRTHDPSSRASEDNSCLRPRGHCDRPYFIITVLYFNIIFVVLSWSLWLNVSVGLFDRIDQRTKVSEKNYSLLETN